MSYDNDSNLNEIQIDTLSACNINAQCIETTNLNANLSSLNRLKTNEFCTNQANLVDICADASHNNHICSQDAQLANICSDSIVAKKICADSMLTKTLCVTNLFKYSSPFNAHVTLNTNTPYILGDIIPFNQIISDSSSALVFDPTRFIAQETGSYILTTQINQKDLTSRTVIVGMPISLLEIYVNNVLYCQTYLPYLNFNGAQTSLLTTLIHLVKGDQLAIKSKIMIMNNTEFVECQGYVTLIGNSSAGLRTFLSIVYLASDVHEECPPCTAQCEPCIVDCQPCIIEYQPCQTHPNS